MVNLILSISFGITVLAMVILLIRLVIGPTVADRGVAIDTLTIVSISTIVFVANFTGRVIYLDVAMVYALISFIGVIVLARYIEGGL